MTSIPAIWSIKKEFDLGDVFYVKKDTGKGTEPDWEYYCINIEQGIVVKFKPRIMQLRVINITSCYYIFNTNHRRSLKLISDSIFNRYYDEMMAQVDKYKK
jgi:hypothetical protein